jgi:hypothetical protein
LLTSTGRYLRLQALSVSDLGSSHHRWGPSPPDLSQIWRFYLARFTLEHTFRLFKQTLGWTTPRVRHPAQADRWTWLLLLAKTGVPALPQSRTRPSRLFSTLGGRGNIGEPPKTLWTLARAPERAPFTTGQAVSGRPKIWRNAPCTPAVSSLPDVPAESPLCFSGLDLELSMSAPALSSSKGGGDCLFGRKRGTLRPGCLERLRAQGFSNGSNRLFIVSLLSRP